MKIAFLEARSWPALGGREALTRSIACGLARGHDVTVLSLRIDDKLSTRLDIVRRGPGFEPILDDGVVTRHLSFPLRAWVRLAPLAAQSAPVLTRYAFSPRVRPAMARYYAAVMGPVIADAAIGVDLIHVWSNDLLGLAGVEAARRLGVPSVITPVAHAGQYGDDESSAVAYRAASSVVALVESEAEVYRRLGVDPDRLVKIGACSYGVPAGRGDALRAAKGITGPLVVFLGVRRPYKGFDLLWDSAERLLSSGADITVAFLGPGPRLPVGPHPDRLLDVGEVDTDTKAAWLEAADLVCLPSEFEIFPVSFLEAWSVRTPVLASDILTLRELLARSGGGRVVRRDPEALADTLAELIANPEELREMGNRGHEFWATSHTVEAVVERHEALYEELVGQRTKTPTQPRIPVEPCRA